MSVVETEHVLVVPTEVFHEVGHFQGFSSEADRYLDRILRPEHISYRPRGEMEDDPSFKQLIPYVIFTYEDEAGQTLLFQYTRGKGQGEKRLQSKRSIGIGGHISSDDAARQDANPYLEGMRRELEEEVSIEAEYAPRCVGLINDDQPDVGRVHLGVVHLFEMSAPRVSPREDAIAQAGFQPLAELLADLDSFETWSSICLQALWGENAK